MRTTTIATFILAIFLMAFTACHDQASRSVGTPAPPPKTYPQQPKPAVAAPQNPDPVSAPEAGTPAPEVVVDAPRTAEPVPAAPPSVESDVLRDESIEVEEVVRQVEAADLAYESPAMAKRSHPAQEPGIFHYREPAPTRESYAPLVENAFVRPVGEAALSTFGLDVDRAAYANVRRFLDQGQLPPAEAVRIEELVNYFEYDYPQPSADEALDVTTTIADCPWSPQHKLLTVGVQAFEPDLADLPPSNLVFLLDVSGSMNQPNKLPLLKQSMLLLLDQLNPTDRVAIVVYAGAAGVVLEPTLASERDVIAKALQRLEAGGSTAGGAGIKLAYQLAEQHFVKGGNNRVVLATDGDFNVGTTSNERLEDLISAKRETGVFLTVLGFGMGNYQDDRLQLLADKGNGNHAYVDNMREAQKVLASEFAGTMHTVAKDVKLQVEFNPAHVGAYRLIGYENRMLEAQDFHDDRKDAGELGAGHTVTAVYELIPAGVESTFLPRVDPLQFQTQAPPAESEATSADWAVVKLKYKRPDASRSEAARRFGVSPNTVSEYARDADWAAAVTAWGLALRDSEHAPAIDLTEVIRLAEAARGTDPSGYRAEAIRLMRLSRDMQAAPELETVGR